jgi:Tol biopolymer transport system component
MLFAIGLRSAALGQALQPTSLSDAAIGAPSGGSGDSVSPVISRDGRYVLFASAANNLLLIGANPITPVFPPKMNVYLRDRTNGTTTLVSVNTSGAGGGDGDSFPVDISTNGQFVVFESLASNLAPGDTNGVTDVFMRDLLHNTTTLVTVSTNGASANGRSRGSVMTPDGRYVAFVSEANNLVSGDTNGIPDIFVRDIVGGTTTLVTVGARGNFVSSSSELPDITPDGRYVVFYSTATNLVSGVQTTGEIYVRDLLNNITSLASANAHSIAQSVYGTNNTICYNHSISDDGHYVAFEASVSPAGTNGIVLRYNTQTTATDTVNTNAAGLPAYGAEINHRSLDMTPDGRFIAYIANTGSGTSAVYVWDAQSAASTLASAVTNNNNVPAPGTCDLPVMDPMGRYVAYLSTASGLVTNNLVGAYHLYRRDMQLGITALVDSDTNSVGALNSQTAVPSLSADGTLVAFDSNDSTLVANDDNHAYDVFVSNLASNSMELISAHLPTLSTVTADGPSTLTISGVSTNGRYVAFYSEADNLVAGDTNGLRDVFVRDTLLGTNILVSVDTTGLLPGNGLSTGPSISADGRYVVFTSSATNLVALTDTNKAQDVFLRDLQTGTTSLVSANSNGAAGNAACYPPILLSYDGRYVLFCTVASDLLPSPTGAAPYLYWRDMQAGTNAFITNSANVGGNIVATMTPDGRDVAVGWNGSAAGDPFIWNSQSNSRTRFTNSTVAPTSIAISPGGSRLMYDNSNAGAVAGVYAQDLISKIILSVSTTDAAHQGFQFTADSRYATYTALDSSKNTQVYVYDFQTQTSQLISKAFNSSAGGNSNSDSAVISADGHYVAYRSAASNIVPDEDNNVPDVFLYDRTTGDTVLVSVSQLGNFSAGSRSLTPVFSGDGHTLVFESWAPDLGAQDFNQTSDIFAVSLAAAGTIPAFSIQLLQPAGGQGPTLSWSAAPGISYQVQYKNHLTDTSWQVFTGSVSVVGTQGYAADLSPGTSQRYYRVLASK